MSTLVPFTETPHTYTQSEVHLDRELGVATLSMSPWPRPSFTPELLTDIRAFQKEVAERVRKDLSAGRTPEIRYTVLTSDMEGIFNFGGDLRRFTDLIRAGDRQSLLEYALTCVELAHSYSVGLDLPIRTIALIEGRAQGGGLEAAVSCQYVIAEKGTQMGFPEVLFNLFPGMGAYSFLSRKIAPALAERMILSGRLYKAEELYEMGVVDRLAEPGQGKEVLTQYIKEAEKHRSVHSLLQRVHNTHHRVPFKELQDITELWVDSALQLSERDLRTMERLVRAQDRRTHSEIRPAN